MNYKKYFIISILLVILISIFGIQSANKRLTYLEYKTFNYRNEEETSITLNHSGDSVVQEFTMPYNILEGISFQIDESSRDKNSTWEFCIIEKGSSKIIYRDIFTASPLWDEWIKIELDNNIRVSAGEKYLFKITAKDVTDISGLVFYVSDESLEEDTEFYYNDSSMPYDLCFRVYGGNADFWWIGFTILIAAFIITCICRVYHLLKSNRNIKGDKVIQGMIVGGLSFLLLCTFAVAGEFCDESDNMYGGIVIANGGVLYRDYVTQHTPVTYYLCSIFALLGARSVEQFRLSYYVAESFVWSFLYFRHSEKFGKKMFLLPILEIICISTAVTPYGTQVLSDGIQGILFVVLTIEYLRYLDDKKLGWIRSIILSICIWGSFGAAFISAYSLIWVAAIVFVVEIVNWKKEKYKFSRYTAFIISLSVPFLLAIIYFKINHALGRAYEQFYLFNREVYPKYITLGSNIAQPFINGVQNFISIIANNINSLITANTTNIILLQLVVLVLFIIIVILLFEKKKYFICSMLFLTMMFSATRGYDFHGMAAWYIAVMGITFYYDLIWEKLKISSIGRISLGIIAIFLLSTFIIEVGNNLLYRQSSISELESKVIELTEEDENKGIFLDVITSGSLYYFYKERYPVNSAVFVLPWYMDWYEQDNIVALNEKQPKVVVYNEDQDVWGYKHFSANFVNELKLYYTRLSEKENHWKYSIWIRNE